MKHFIIMFLAGISTTFFAQVKSLERVKHFNLENRLAIQGYDPVAYFYSGKAIKGVSKNQSMHLGVIYYFSSETNKKTFETNPSKYEPQYGKWCAFAMGDSGNKVAIDPKTFKIINGKLYLFYNAYFNNTLKSWNKNEKNLKAKADKNWFNFLK